MERIDSFAVPESLDPAYAFGYGDLEQFTTPGCTGSSAPASSKPRRTAGDHPLVCERVVSMFPNKKLLTMLVAGVLATSFAACGDDEEEPAAPAATPTEAVEPATDDTATEDATTEDPSGGGTPAGATDEQIQAAIEACKQQVGSVPTISDDTRADLEQLCDKAASGDVQDAQETAREVCRKIVEDSVPEGQARETALAACDTAGG